MKKAAALLLALALLVSIAAAADMPENGYAYVVSGTSDRVHLRAAPSTDAASLGLYFTGTRVTLLNPPGGEWTQIAVGSEQGWMMSRYLSTDPAVAKQCDARREGRVVAGSLVNLREAPGTDAARVTWVENGNRVIILGETADHWYYVRHVGLAGYIKADYVLTGEITTEPLTPAVPEAFVGVMTGWETLHFTPAGEYMFIDSLDRYYNGSTITFPFYAVADVNHDGRNEVILTLQRDSNEYYGFLVLTEVEGNVWGYEYFYRAMIGLKADGTFSFSSGAADNGFGYASFGTLSPGIVTLGERSSLSGHSFYLNGEQVSEETYRQAVQIQDQKPDAVWYPFEMP